VAFVFSLVILLTIILMRLVQERVSDRRVSLVLILSRVESPNPACIHSWGYRSDASAFKVARFSALQLRAIVCIRKTFDHSLIRLVAFLPMTQRELSQRDLTKENQYD
jgi:hypothetical protein